MNFLSNIFFFVFFLLLLLLLCSVACFHMFASLIRFPASLYFPFFILNVDHSLIHSPSAFTFFLPTQPAAETHSQSLPLSHLSYFLFMLKKGKNFQEGKFICSLPQECVFSFRLYHVQHSFI